MFSFILNTLFLITLAPVFPQAIFLDQAINVKLYKDIDTSYSLGPELTAESALTVNLENGEVCFSKNSSKILPIASITKLMSTLIFLENRIQEWDEKILIKEEDLIINSESDNDIEPSGLNIRAGQSIELEDIFMAGLIKSANDTMKILARLINLSSDKNFVYLMNEKAQFLGMKNTIFVEPTGLDAGNKSTAEDIVKLILEIMKQDKIREALKIRTYDFPVFEINGQKNYQRVWNTDKLLGTFVNLTGAKTGYLEESGYCFAGLSNYKDKQLVVILLNAATDQVRFQEAKSLIWWSAENCQNILR